ncbi:3-oxoacyl-acyl-carrier-protein reductase, partial [Aphelenchoides avenae]
ETQKLISEAGVPASDVFVVKGPIEDDAVIKELIEGTVNKFGKLDVLVNNAGTSHDLKADPDAPETFDYLFNINLKRYFAIPHLEKAKGNIVNISSVGAQRAFGDYIFYQSTKAALDHYTRNTAVKYAPKGIRINALK